MKRTYSARYAATQQINNIPNQILEKIFQNLDEISLVKAEQVCKKWNDVIKSNWIWKPLVKAKVENDSNWKELAERRGWIQDLFNQNNSKPDSYYRSLFPKATRVIRRINSNFFSKSRSTRQLLEVPMDVGESMSGPIEVNDKNIFVGTSEGNIKIMNRKGPIQWNTLTGHTNDIEILQGRFL